MEARCMRCKKDMPMKNTYEDKFKNGMKAMRGECTQCGCKMCRIMGKAEKNA